MNRYQLSGWIIFICWLISALIFLPTIFDLFELILENMVSLWDSIFELNFIKILNSIILILIGMIIWIPYYMVGLSSILLMFEDE